MKAVLVVLALLTGVITGGVFAALRIPIPAPPTIVGVMGIVGIYLGYKAVEYTGVGFDLLARLGF
jgi:XapX domain-containing protein